MPSIHKLWKVCTTTLLMMLATQFTLMGFFKSKELLENKTDNPTHMRNDRKVVLMLVDGMREDFIDWGPNSSHKFLID